MFSKNIKLPFTLAGIPLYLHFSFLLVLPLMAWTIASRIPMWADLWHIHNSAALQTGLMPYLLGLTAALGLFVCVILHELGHALTARYFGVSTRSITLWFLGGVASLNEIPRKHGVEAIIGIAGPLVSINLAILFFLPLPFLPLAAPIQFILAYLASTNLGLALFNLIPALPLDGGRILRSLLALAMQFTTATRIAATISKLLALALGIFGLFTGQLFLMLIALFVYIAGNAEIRATYLEDFLRKTNPSPDPR